MTLVLDARTARQFGWRGAWLVLTVTLLAGALPIAWRALQVSEARAMQATLDNLALGFVARAAEEVVAGHALDRQWLAADPFRQLRWQPDDYCGELADGERPRRGCWHYLPQRGWVLYRSRFQSGAWTNAIHGYALRRVPAKAVEGLRDRDGVVSLELEPVPAGQLAKWMSAIEEQARR